MKSRSTRNNTPVHEKTTTSKVIEKKKSAKIFSANETQRQTNSTARYNIAHTRHKHEIGRLDHTQHAIGVCRGAARRHGANSTCEMSRQK